MSDARVVPAGDAAWLIELENRLDAEVNARAIAIGHAVRASGLAGLRDVVTGYRSVAVYVDPVLTEADTAQRLERLARDAAAGTEDAARVVDVPVCYGGSLGPDLAEVAAFAGCSQDEVVALHGSRTSCSSTRRPPICCPRRRLWGRSRCPRPASRSCSWPIDRPRAVIRRLPP